MPSHPTPSWRHEPRQPLTFLPARQLAATALRGASALLAQLAMRLVEPVRPGPCPDPQFEFHADAGAPEGALYVDGRLVGWLSGVHRL